MRRRGSRYGLPPTNRSLKYALVPFQDLKGCIGEINLPDSPVALSLKKQARWKWADNCQPDPAWLLDRDRLLWYKAYTVFNTRVVDYPKTIKAELRRSGDKLICVECVGQARNAPKRRQSTDVKEITCDKRHEAYSANQCCGCTLCSFKPRNKALKKVKGRRKHSRQALADEMLLYDGILYDEAVGFPSM